MFPTIAILGSDSDAELKHAFQDLAAALQLRVEFSASTDLPKVAAVVCVGDLPKNLPAVPTFQFVSGKPPSANRAIRMLKFAGNSILPGILRERKLPLGKESDWGFLGEKQPGEVVATINDRPVWTITEEQGNKVWSVSTPLPRLRSNERLAHYLNGETFLPLLPLYLFLRGISSESRWQAPPLRACMVVDDPNLHAQTYGHIRYQALVQLARKCPFHATMATVPIDGWWTSAKAAKIFRENPQALSLQVHGNDHLHHELAGPFLRGDREALVSESLSRIESLENKKNIRVDRVMAPPHGVCAPEMFSALRAGGYEGMTTNRWSLWKHNPPEQLPLNFGLHPADLLGGLPVLNRFRFKSSICDGEILMAAVLGQPIIPYGHHQDFADDMVHVRSVIEKVNSLPVRWLSLREVLETNYEHYINSGTLHLRLFSRRVKLTLPPGVRSIQIEPTPFQTEKPQTFEIAWQQKRIVVQPEAHVTDLPARVELEIRAVTHPQMTKRTCYAARKSPSVRLRRLASEFRDRLKFKDSSNMNQIDIEQAKTLVLTSIQKVQKWVEDHDYKAYEPFDGLSSWTRPLTFGTIMGDRLLMQLIRQSPVNLRPLFGVTPKESTKGRGYMARGYLALYRTTGREEFKNKAIECLRWLDKHKARKYAKHSWANHFDFSSRGGRYTSEDPIIVWTSLIGQAYLDAYEVTRDKWFLEIAESVCGWIMDLPREKTATGNCLSYLMPVQNTIHNANMLGAAMLARTAKITGNRDYMEVARSAMEYSVSRQLPDGSWWYAEYPNHQWIDNFHTGYNLDSLKCYIENSGDETWRPNLLKGLDFFKTHFFEPSGRPKYYHTRTYPVDSQCAAQAIETLADFSDLDPACLDLSVKVARWTIENMQDADGHFYYRQYPLGIKARAPMLHWAQATTFKALAQLHAKLADQTA